MKIMTPTRQQFAEEDRRIRQLKKQGWSGADIKSWLRGWRQVPAGKK